jgi:uncharacterized peroxidase-related enzyme
LALLSNLPEPASLADVMAAYPDLARLAVPLAQHILRGPSPLSPALRELLFAYGSALNACSFCAGMHRAVAEALGADGSLVEALLADIDTAPVADRERPLFHYLRKLTLTPSRMAAEDAAAVRAAGWSDDALHGVVAVSALHNFFNRWVDGCGVRANAAELRAGGRQFAEYGYRLDGGPTGAPG